MNNFLNYLLEAFTLPVIVMIATIPFAISITY